MQDNQTKVEVSKTCVFSTAVCACETCMVKKTDAKKILAFNAMLQKNIKSELYAKSDQRGSTKITRSE